MFRDEHNPGRLETLTAIRDAVVAGDDVRAAHLAVPFTNADSVERVVVSAMDRVRYEQGTDRRFTGGLIRWLRRAARDDQTWAHARIGLEWWPDLDLNLKGHSPDDVTDEPEIEHEESTRCLEIAAARGHRRAAFRHGTLESLITAYGDGTPDHEITAEELRSVEARIARHLAASGDADAGRWFRRAIAYPRWEDADGDETWLSAMSGYALWVHGRGDIELCEQLSARLIDDVVQHAVFDRRLIDGDAHKRYRDSYQLATGNEAVRMSAMEHLLTGHDLSPEMALELLRLVTRNHYFRVESRPLVARVWEGRYGPVADTAAVEDRAWAFIGWLLAEVVPMVLRLVGCTDHADHVERKSADIDFSAEGFRGPDVDRNGHIRELRRRQRGDGTPLDAAESAELEDFILCRVPRFYEFVSSVIRPGTAPGWQEANDRAESADEGMRKILSWWQATPWETGLGATESSFETGFRQIVSDHRFRLLSGSDAWLAMWLATTAPVPAGWQRTATWSDSWDLISPMIAEYLELAARISAGREASGNAEVAGMFAAAESAINEGARRHVDGILAAALGTLENTGTVG